MLKCPVRALRGAPNPEAKGPLRSTPTSSPYLEIAGRGRPLRDPETIKAKPTACPSPPPASVMSIRSSEAPVEVARPLVVRSSARPSELHAGMEHGLSPERKRLKTSAMNEGTDAKIARLLSAPPQTPKVTPSSKPKPTNRVLEQELDLVSNSRNPAYPESSLVFGAEQYVGDSQERLYSAYIGAETEMDLFRYVFFFLSVCLSFSAYRISGIVFRG